MSAAESLTEGPRAGTPVTMARPKRGHELVGVKVTPKQAKALRDAAARAKLEGRPNAGDGMSLVVRELVQGWMDAGAKWPGSNAPNQRRKKP